MTETVTWEMVLACAQDLSQDIKELKAEMATLKTEIRAMNSEFAAASKKLAPFVQLRLAEGQTDSGK